MMKGKIPLRLSNRFWYRFVALLILLFFVIVPFSSHARVFRGKVISVQGDVMELDLGIEKGVQLGDSGRVYYNILIQGNERPIFIAKFKITHVSEKSSVAQLEEKTGEVKVGHQVEIFLKGGELELSSDPPGGKVYVDGKEKGETPAVLSDVSSGSHVIRIVKQGYEPYEEQIKVVEGERKKVSASLTVSVGSLLINTDPSGANIFIDEKSVGVSPYDGRNLSPGTHRVRVIKEGYDYWEQYIDVEAGRRVKVFAMLREEKKERPKAARLPDEETASKTGESVLFSSLVEKGPTMIRENNYTKLIEDIDKLSAAERRSSKIMVLECFAHLKNVVLRKDKNSKDTFENRYKVLQRSQDRNVTPLLIQIIKDPEAWTRLYAVALLGDIGDREALDDLREIAANDSNKKIRERASKSILLIEKRK